MNVVLHIELSMVALFAGFFLSSRIGVWIVTIYFSLRGKDAPAGGAEKLKRIVLATLLHSAPWLVAVAAIFAFYVHSAPWAGWVFGGAFIGMLLYIAVVLSRLRKVRRRREENAA